jgi:hypothetical protein
MGVIYEQAFAFAFGALEQELYFDTATVGASTNLYVTLGGTYRLIG